MTPKAGMWWSSATWPLFDAARRATIRAQRLDELGLVPPGRFEQIAQTPHARGTSIVPFSRDNIDLILQDLGTPLPRRTRASQWLRSAVPQDYQGVLAQTVTRFTP